MGHLGLRIASQEVLHPPPQGESLVQEVGSRREPAYCIQWRMPVNLRILLHWNVFLGIEVLNNQRPHEALDMKCPAEVYQPSQRVYSGLPDVDYPLDDKTIVVTRRGRICLGRKEH